MELGSITTVFVAVFVAVVELVLAEWSSCHIFLLLLVGELFFFFDGMVGNLI